MKRTTIEHSDLWKIAHALRVAADRFIWDANMCKERTDGGSNAEHFRGLRQQFEWQAADARRYAELIEAGNRLVIETDPEEVADA